MSKNLIPKIAQMLGVELGEEFKIKGYDGLIYNLTDNGLELTAVDGQKTKWFDHGALNCLLKGKMEIVKLPWKPKRDEVFYTFGIHATEDKWVVISCKWWNNVKNLSLYRVGWIYRSQAEAEAALPTVAKEMGVEYEL